MFTFCDFIHFSLYLPQITTLSKLSRMVDVSAFDSDLIYAYIYRELAMIYRSDRAIIARPVNVWRHSSFGYRTARQCSITKPAFIGFNETSSYWSVSLVSVTSDFHWSLLIGKPRMTPASFVNTSAV